MPDVFLMKSLRKHRKEAGLTLSQAGKILKIDTGNLSRIERGKQIPGYATACALANLYGISLDNVYGRKNGSASRKTAVVCRIAMDDALKGNE